MRSTFLALGAVVFLGSLACQRAQEPEEHLPTEEDRAPAPGDRPLEAEPPPGAPTTPPTDGQPTPTPPTPPAGEAGRALPGPLPDGVTVEMIAEGRKVFMGLGRCQACHGIEGRGTIQGPALSGPNWLHIDGSYPELVRIISQGVSRPKRFPLPMPPRGGAPLSDQHVRSVAAYVWSLRAAN